MNPAHRFASIPLTEAEIRSGIDRVAWAEGLIRQLPEDHDGRNAWLANFGTGAERRPGALGTRFHLMPRNSG